MTETKTKTRFFLIQGLFFQNNEYVGISYASGEARTVIRPLSCREMYFGAFTLGNNNTSGTGELIDQFGESYIYDIQMTETTLKFTKQYASISRMDEIQYTLTKNGDHWAGYYDGPVTGKNETKCVINEVPASFFLPLLPEFADKLRQIALLQDPEKETQEIFTLFDDDGLLLNYHQAENLIEAVLELNDPDIKIGLDKVIKYAETHNAPGVQAAFQELGLI